MEQSSPPEILRSNLAKVILSLKAVGIQDIQKFDFLDKPSDLMFSQSLKQLWQLNCLDVNDELTAHGQEMAVLPTDPLFSNLLLESLKPEYSSVTEMVISLVSLLSVENIFYLPWTDSWIAEWKHKRFLCPYSDHLTYVNVYNEWRESKRKNIRGFSKENFLNEKSLKKAKQIWEQIKDYMN